jgi:aspartate racemase
MQKQTIGIVGGMGSHATAYFFKQLLDSLPAEKEWDRPRIVIDNNCAMPSRVRAILYNEREEELIAAMSATVSGLAEMGCSLIVLACVTAHYFLPKLDLAGARGRHEFECIDLLGATAREIQRGEHLRGVGQLYVCCTEGTAQTRLWDAYLGNRAVYPDEGELRELRGFIEAVKQNTLAEREREAFGAFLSGLPHESIILGCTELPALYRPGLAIGKRVYDPLQCGIDEIKRRLS